MFNRVYLSGPITGTKDAPERFILSAIRASNFADAVANPVEFNKNLPAETPWEVYMEIDLRLLEECDTIYMMHGWENARGCNDERNKAIEKGLNVLYEDKIYEQYYAQ